MLIGFKLSNFRSFLCEQEFSFSLPSGQVDGRSGYIRTGLRAVPRLKRTGVIFGANGSGKSNLLKALATLRDLVVHSAAYSDSQFSERYEPFQLDSSSRSPTHFEIDVILDHVRYRYALSYNRQRVTSERLLVYRTGKAQHWFGRHFDETESSESWRPFSPNFNGPREMWRKATRPTALFLTTAARLDCEQLKPLLHWFEHGLDILFPNDTIDMTRVITHIGDVKFKERILNLLRASDMQIDDVRVSDHSFRLDARPLVDFLYSRTGQPPVWLDPKFEAAGTHRLFALLGPLLEMSEEGKLLVIDEFDTSLHPMVARVLIRLAQRPMVATNDAQLLVTSHNSSLMDPDILRRNEIWLTELDQDHATHLTLLTHSRPRKGELISKNYLRGRYGAVPHIDGDIAALTSAAGENSDEESARASHARAARHR